MKCPNHPSNNVVDYYLIKVNNTGKQMYVGTCCSTCANEISKSLVSGNGKYTFNGKYLMKNGKKVQLLRSKYNSKSKKLTKSKSKTKRSAGKYKTKKSYKLIGGVNVSDLINTKKVSDKDFMEFIENFITTNANENNIINDNIPNTIILNFKNICHGLNSEFKKTSCELLFINIYGSLCGFSKSNNNITCNKDTGKITINYFNNLYNSFINSSETSESNKSSETSASNKSSETNEHNQQQNTHLIRLFEAKINELTNTTPSSKPKYNKESNKIINKELMKRFFRLYFILLKEKNSININIQQGGSPIVIIAIFIGLSIYFLYKISQKQQQQSNIYNI